MLLVHAYIEVTEIERGIEFYAQGLGLMLQRRLSPSWVELDGVNLPIFLLANRPPVADLGSTTAARDYPITVTVYLPSSTAAVGPIYRAVFGKLSL
jgi:hypothetical protein